MPLTVTLYISEMSSNLIGFWATIFIDEANASGGGVILAFFRADNDPHNSDYSLNITIKYHVR